MRKLIPILVIVIIYLIFSQLITGNIFKLSYYPYYTFLLDSFSQGKLFISSYSHDLSLFEGKYYPYWGIGPTLFIYPFYLFGIKSDVFYTLIAGILNVFLFSLLLKEFLLNFKIKLSKFKEFFLVLCFAFISPNFFLSLNGRIWHTEKVISVLFLLLFLYFLFKYVNSNFKKFSYIFLSILLFNIAWLSRLTFIFYGLMFVYLTLLIYKEKIVFKKFIITFSVLFLLGISIFATYNYARFRNSLETGLSYHIPAARYADAVFSKKLFSLNYIPHNLETYFLNPIKISLTDGKVYFDPEGNSILSVYPFFLLLFFLFQIKHLKDKKKLYFLLVSALVLVFEFVLILLYFATGWVQFGSRYIADIVPLALLMSAFAVESISSLFLLLILIYGIIINLFGTLFFYQKFPI